ncbi:MAG: hypothetical protein GVY19_14175 [Bacteroidetes bacterium]|jgi:hypothetical protein|nr:hypothetical protein [Bacteroidota bacterium]
MKAYRQIVDIKNHTLNILLPDKFNNGKVEVIVLPVDEQARTKKRKPSDFRGCISKDTATAMLNSIEDSRKEWERNI